MPRNSGFLIAAVLLVAGAGALAACTALDGMAKNGPASGRDHPGMCLSATEIPSPSPENLNDAGFRAKDAGVNPTGNIVQISQYGGYGIRIVNSDNNTITGSTIRGNEVGIVVEGSSSGNLIAGNIVEGNSQADITAGGTNNTYLNNSGVIHSGS